LVLLISLFSLALGTTFAQAQAQPDAAKRSEENPLLQVARQMQQAESLLAKPQPGDATKKVQDEIVANLDRLLESCQNCSPSPGGQCQPKPGDKKKPGKPGEKSGSPGAKPNPNPKNSGTPSPKDAAAARREAARLRQYRDFVAKLPQRDREQVQGSSIEEFLPKYQALIEAYFRDLEGEQTIRKKE
jgi:type II secretory pathway pseudopilin PulG